MSITDPASIANIWTRVRSMFVRVSDIVGAIPALARLTLLWPSRQREIASAIALVETIVRKLIFIEAAPLPSEATPPTSALPPTTAVWPKKGVAPKRPLKAWETYQKVRLREASFSSILEKPVFLDWSMRSAAVTLVLNSRFP